MITQDFVLYAMMKHCNNMFEVDEGDRVRADTQDKTMELISAFRKKVHISSFIFLRGEFNTGLRFITDREYLPRYGLRLTFSTELTPTEDSEYLLVRLDVPADFIELSERIKEFIEKTPKTPIVAETWENTAYRLDPHMNTWQEAFKNELAIYRRAATPNNLF